MIAFHDSFKASPWIVFYGAHESLKYKAEVLGNKYK